MSPRAPGWFPDPTFPTRLRYFDGLAWTNHTDPSADDVRPVIEDEPSSSAPPQGPAYGALDAPQPASPKPSSPFADSLPPRYSYGRVGGGPTNAVKANYGRRIVAYLIDSAVPVIVFAAVIGSWLVAVFTASPGSTTSVVASPLLALVVLLAVSAFMIWNSLWRQGNTGQSIGKKAMGIALVGLDDDLPIGLGRAVARAILPSVAAIVLGIVPLVGLLAPVVTLLDYLWPLWDKNGQRLVDKPTNSRVVDVNSIGV